MNYYTISTRKSKIAAGYLANSGLIEINRPHYMIDNDSLKSSVFELEDPFVNKEKNKDSWLKLMPNPASKYFIISYKLPSDTKSASILINAINGNTIKTIMVYKSQGEFVVESSDIKSGFYSVSLLNGTTVLESKKLIISK